MARTCMQHRELRRAKLNKRYAEKIKKLQQLVKMGDHEEAEHARIVLNKLPRDAHKTRQTRRCRLCQRSRGVYRVFALCRICLRKAASRGDITGIVKSSW